MRRLHLDGIRCIPATLPALGVMSRCSPSGLGLSEDELERGVRVSQDRQVEFHE